LRNEAIAAQQITPRKRRKEALAEVHGARDLLPIASRPAMLHMSRVKDFQQSALKKI
jgi:hypothetical protein